MAPTSKLNHVAMSVSAHLFDEVVRAEIVAFFGEVFGWNEQPVDEPGNPLVLRVGVDPTQFIFVQPEVGDATRSGPMDHFGVEVSSKDALDEILTSAREYRQRDRRVEIVDKQLVTTPSADGTIAYETINCYIRFLLPLWVEVQHFRRSASTT
jgi:hypothetical protein